MSAARENLYDRMFDRAQLSGLSAQSAAELVAEAYLDGKPRTRGKHKIAEIERCRAFWSSEHLGALPLDIWRGDTMTLALARYMSQDRYSNFAQIERIAQMPDVLRRATRYSGLVLRPQSPRRQELYLLARRLPHVAELCNVLVIFEQAHRLRKMDVLKWQTVLEDLSAVDLLLYASMFAFERLIPEVFAFENGKSMKMQEVDSRMQTTWDAIADIFNWRLRGVPAERLNVIEDDIGHSLATHLAPFLFPMNADKPVRHDLREAFEMLVAAQTELNEFLERSADAFSFDDAIDFFRQDLTLQITEVDAASRARWVRDGRRLELLHGYWFYRALHEFADSDVASKVIGRPENHESNRLAYIRAMRTRLQLMEVYGLNGTVTADTGERVDLFQALLSLELMSAFFQRDFLYAFSVHLKTFGNWAEALRVLATEGIFVDRQNRLPLTWADREDKIAKIVGWTVSPEAPGGSRRMAGAILDFWTSDWVGLAERLRQGGEGLTPELFERPVLKLGPYLFQLPWLVGLQNNSTAAINNLRRLGARRGEAAEENRRIEERLGRQFEARGFKVERNWFPSLDDPANAGEVDLICARDGCVLVIEVKSTFLRRSQREAWFHATTTLRKAGKQLQRKVMAVNREFAVGSQLRSSLSLKESSVRPTTFGLIVDTSIEHDHRRFHGFLKISLEEALIALRDDRHLLNDPAKILNGQDGGSMDAPAGCDSAGASLYPSGFSFTRFLEVVEGELVWAESSPSLRAD